MKRQALMCKGLGCWLSIIDLLLQRFAGIEKVIEREENDPMVVMATIINGACAIKDPSASEAHLRQRLAHLPLFHYRATRPGEPWDPLSESLEAFMARGSRPTFWEDPQPYPQLHVVEGWLNQQIDCENSQA
jgi:hypothetical protein